MATVRYFWHGFIHRGTTFMYLQNSRSPYYHLFPNAWKASYTISASIFDNVPYSQPYSKDKFIYCVAPGPSQLFFHFGEAVVITWTRGRTLQEIRDGSSGVTLCVAWRMMGFCTTKCRRFLLSAMPYATMNIAFTAHCVRRTFLGKGKPGCF